MTSSFKSIPPAERNSHDESSYRRDIAGKITETIGSGKPAQEAIVWKVVTWSFYAALGIMVLLFVKSFCSSSDFSLKSIQNVWSIFIPVITLALGYIFGKGGN